jgi:septal ring factor EnvC (AmiA/AmiB activator)
MKQQCIREWRTGETCGAKLLHDQHMSRSDSYCKICLEIGRKKRRMQKEQENIDRWKQEPHKFKASIEKAESERAMLMRIINDLEKKRPRVAFSLHGGN